MNRFVLINLLTFTLGAVGYIAHPNGFGIVAMVCGAVSAAIMWGRS